MLFQWVLVKLSAEQKTVKLLWVAYLSSLKLFFFLALKLLQNNKDVIANTRTFVVADFKPSYLGK
jgi:hypothetical protein